MKVAHYDARRERVRFEMQKLAWQTSYLLQPHRKKGQRVTPKKLLGADFFRGESKAARQPTDPEALRVEFWEIKAEMDRRIGPRGTSRGAVRQSRA